MARANANRKSPAKRARKKSSSPSASRSGGVTNEERILQAIGSQTSFGESKPAKKLIMAMATMTNENSFRVTLQNIKKKGFVDYDKTTIWLTEKGRNHIGSEALAVPATNEAIQEKIRTDMIKGGKPREIFEIMLDGEWHSKEELAARMNVPNKDSFRVYISALSKVVERENKKIRLKDMCFPFGRP